jgi:hypothetical protein
MTTALARTATPLRNPSTKPAAKAAPRKATPLKLVPSARSSAARTPFVVVVVTLLVSGLLGLLLLNMVVAQGSFQLHALAKQGKALDLREQELASRVQAMQAPGVLAQRATALGMVPGGPPAFLQLPSGKVLGQPTAGVAPAPKATATPTTQVTSKPAAAKTATKPATKPTTKPASKPTTTATAASTRSTGTTAP